jgi:DNA primase
MADDVDRVRRSLPSLDRYVRSHANNTTTDLSKEGSELRGSNPFHGSSTGNNFAVDTSENQWYCHSKGCEAGGGILEYIAVDEGLVDCGETSDISAIFPEVLEVAAEIAGVDLGMDAQDRTEMRKRRQERELLDDIFTDAAEFYNDHLSAVIPIGDDQVVTVSEYMKAHYGLSEETLNEAKVGLAPNKETALLNALDYDQEDMLKSGLVIRTGGGVVDFFSGRIIFPYFERGTPRYFIGRKTPLTPDEDWERGKYRKLPRSDAFDEVSEQVDEPIYGADAARQSDRVIVTEGVTDVLAARQHGYAAIAPVTTSFKEDRLRDVARFVSDKDVTVIMDEDPETEAGIEGAIKTASALERSTSPTTEVSVGRLPLDDGDIADYLKQATTGGGVANDD